MCFIALIGLHAVAQGTIQGKITDEKGEALFGVNVITDKMEGTSTDFDGNYSLNVKAGAFTLELSAIGYEIQEHKLNIADGQKIYLNYQLKEEELEVESIVVYGSKRARTLEEEIQTVEVLDATILEKNNVTNGVEAVELLSGVTVLDGQMSVRSGSGYAYGVGSRVMLAIDELPMLTPEREEINWDVIPTENIEQMELQKSGGGVEYGASALNGVLNVRSKWAKKKHETEIGLYNSVVGEPLLDGMKWWKNEKNYFNKPHKSGLSVTHRSKLKKNVDITFSSVLHSFQSHLKGEFNNRFRGNFNLRYRPEKAEGLSLGFYSMAMYRHDSFAFIWKGNKEKAYLTSASYAKRYAYGLLHPFASYYDKKGNTFKYNGALYFDKMTLKGSLNNSLNVYNDFRYQRKFKFNLNIVLGATAENKFVQAPALRSKYFPNDTEGWFTGGKYGFYALADYKIKSWNFSAGARYDLVNFIGKVLSSKPVFNAGINFKASKNDFLRFSFNQSFRIPNIAERYVNESLGPVKIYPNPDIKPETGYNFEIGYKRMLNYKKAKGYIDIALFWTEFDNMIEFNFGNHATPEDTVPLLGFKAENVARARILGFEISADETIEYKAFTFMAYLGYTYAYGVDLNQNAQAKNLLYAVGASARAFAPTLAQKEAFENNPTGNLGNNPLAGMLKYRFRHTFKADLSVEYKNATFGTNMAYYSYMDNVDQIFKIFIPGVAEDRANEEFKGKFILDLRAGYTLNQQLKFNFIVENVLNTYYALRPSKPSAPRTFTLQTKFSF